MPHMLRAEASGEVTVLERMCQMIVRIIGPLVVPDPIPSRIDVRRTYTTLLTITATTILLHRAIVVFGRIAVCSTITILRIVTILDRSATMLRRSAPHVPTIGLRPALRR